VGIIVRMLEQLFPLKKGCPCPNAATCGRSVASWWSYCCVALGPGTAYIELMKWNLLCFGIHVIQTMAKPPALVLEGHWKSTTPQDIIFEGQTSIKSLATWGSPAPGKNQYSRCYSVLQPPMASPVLYHLVVVNSGLNTFRQVTVRSQVVGINIASEI
jgi:hypothetical protein